MVMSDSQASAGVSKHLSGLASSYVNDPSLYACEQVAVPLHQSGVISFNFQRNQAGWSDLANTIRVKGQTAMQLDDENETTKQGVLDEHATRQFIAERDVILGEQAGKTRQQIIENAVRRVSGSLMVNREKELADLITTSGNYASGFYGAAGAYWTPGTSGSDPVADVLKAMSKIATGPAVGGEYFMVADESIWLKLMGNEAIRKACGGISYAPSVENIGQILHVQPVVAKAKFNGGTSMLGNKAIVYKRPLVVVPEDESAVCSFRLIHNHEMPVVIRQYSTEDMVDNGFWVQANANYKIITPYANASDKINSAYLITGLTA